jgi:predicted ester cyclase
VLHPDVTFRGSLGSERCGRPAFAEYLTSVTTALGAYRCDIEHLVVEGPSAAARMTFSGVHRAPFLGYPATGRRVAWAGAAFFAFDGELVRDLWVLGDLDGLHRQLR